MESIIIYTRTCVFWFCLTHKYIVTIQLPSNLSLYHKFLTRNPGLDQKWSTLDQIWSTLDQKWSNPKCQVGPELVQPQNIFLRFLVRNFCPKFYFSKLFKVLKKYFRNINSFMHFQVRSGPGWTRSGQTWDLGLDHFWSRVDHTVI